MRSDCKTVDEYIASLGEDQREPMTRLRSLIRSSMTEKLQEGMGYGMIEYSVPLAVYPKGYHCTPDTPLPFLALAAQKNSINLYHMALYAQEGIAAWFAAEYAKTAMHKLDIGKSCIRFKYYSEIPYDLIAELLEKITVQDWIDAYDKLRPQGK